MRTQQLGQRQARTLGLQVPQRHIKRTNGLRRQATAPHRGTGPAQLVPQLGDVAGVFADQHRGDLARMRKLPRPACALGIAEPQALVALRSLHLHKQHGDFGHGLLAARQHLGIADGLGQRQVARRHAQPGDAVARGSGGGSERGRSSRHGESFKTTKRNRKQNGAGQEAEHAGNAAAGQIAHRPAHRPAPGRAQSSEIFPASITRFQRADSACWKAANCAGVLTTISNPMETNCSRTAGWFSASAMAA